jgi:Acyl carrier protein phosphodiesterase
MSKTALYIDCCIRGNASRTRTLADAFFSALPGEYQVTRLDLTREDLRPLAGRFFEEREALLARHELDHPRFRYAHQLAQADLVVIAAPFWDLSFPALLKLYIENVSVEGITFGADAQGLHGLCRAEACVFLTTRGGSYGPGYEMEQGSRYLEALQKFFGFQSYTCVAAEGLDEEGANPSVLLNAACRQAYELAARL